MAYALLERLKDQQEESVLSELSSFVNETDRAKGQLHAVFETSFDWKECYSKSFILQKLNYIHQNPCRGIWRLAPSPQDYEHSSAKYYLLHQQGRYDVIGYNEQGRYDVIGYNELQDIDLTH